ncbi:MAG TPA: hypothetical protein VMZ73_06230 [Acidimicrobiales bacterium]|nr:hypothetical protein [Acidimicrobiales bacterium]
MDRKPLHEWYQRLDDVENMRADLSTEPGCADAVRDRVNQVFNLASGMGGMGFIEK